ncbi:porin [Vibrio hangzhouensis]|uniref:Outer membrane protein (Porin) n=1 Tax=Vibrio hangzhouensis TaxID=462991 RepID=A0A1H5X7L7_9VIBR|nr:porin [Vibrio hangzhouensis]SEG07390.1 Outer membrane protein (porin) [Vibrio hangzhouensis]
MKKLAIAIAMILSAPALAESDAATVSAEQSSAANISELSSTADKPNNLYDFIENDKLSGVAYAGAELGGNVLFDDKNNSFEHSYMFKVGADLSYAVTDSFSLLMGGEARYQWVGYDSKVEPINYVDRFVFGAKSAAGVTTFGKQCGIADVYLGFGDISKEHGLGAEADEAACTDEQLNHHYFGENFDIGATWEHSNDAWAVGGSATVGPVVIGGTYVDIAKGENSTDAQNLSEKVYTIGAVAVFDKFNFAAKYDFADVETTGTNNEETTGYALGIAYQATTNLSISSTYNSEEYNFTEAGRSYMEDDWFTIGASYRLNEHLELVTDYKFSSEDDDKLFLRANVNL